MGFKGVSRKIDEAAIGSSKLLCSHPPPRHLPLHIVYIFWELLLEDAWFSTVFLSVGRPANKPGRCLPNHQCAQSQCLPIILQSSANMIGYERGRIASTEELISEESRLIEALYKLSLNLNYQSNDINFSLKFSWHQKQQKFPLTISFLIPP